MEDIATAAGLHGEAGADTLNGGGGKDWLDGGPGADLIIGGGGWDCLDYSLRTAPLLVTPDGLAPDDGESTEADHVADIWLILGGSAGDELRAAATGGYLQGRDGDDELHGGPGVDYLDGGNGVDSLRGEAGGDTLDGSAGDDGLAGGDGSDRLIDGPGAGVVNGDGGNDQVVAGSGADRMHGGPGYDYADYSARTAPVVISMAGGASGEAGEGDLLGADFEAARGGEGADTLTGGPSHEELWGNGGDDDLHGLGGYDSFIAGSGNDRVYARDGVTEHVNCGPGYDEVVADRHDMVYDCESVQRPTDPVPPPPSPAPPPPFAASSPGESAAAATLPTMRPNLTSGSRAKAPHPPDTTPPLISVTRRVVPGRGHASLPVRIGCPDSELRGSPAT